MSHPHKLSTNQLVALGSHAVDQLARSALGTLTNYRLLLGRCLLAIGRSQTYLEFGCSSAIHYAVSQLGLSAQNARATLRVVRQLEDLPLLTLAAEEGWLSWSKLREVARVATPESEPYWLEMCKQFNYHDLERLVSCSAGRNSQEPVLSHLRLQLGPDALQVLERTVQVISQEAGRALSPAQALELVCADYLARHAPAHWENPRLRFNPESRMATAARPPAAPTTCSWKSTTSNSTLSKARPCPIIWSACVRDVIAMCTRGVCAFRGKRRTI
jgi:hypothetical protein